MKCRARVRGLGVAALVLIGLGSSARGGLVTTLTVAQGPASGGLTQYTYTLTNSASSDQLASVFQVDVAPGANLQAISNNIGWDVTYSPGATTIIWTSAILPNFSTNDLAPGGTGLFSFQSALGPVSQPFLIVGTDPAGGFGDTASGLIAGPGASIATPEPSSLVTVALGLAALAAVRLGSRRGRP